jgi:hypothetical protein
LLLVTVERQQSGDLQCEAHGGEDLVAFDRELLGDVVDAVAEEEGVDDVGGLDAGAEDVVRVRKGWSGGSSKQSSRWGSSFM